MQTHTLGRHVSDRSPLLVYADPLDTHREVACSGLLHGAATDPQHLLVFAYHRRPRVVTERVRDHLDTDPASLTILDLGDGDRRPAAMTDLGTDVHVEREAATNLTRIGIAVTEAIERAETGDLQVCLGSLTTLVQYVGVETAFKFLHVTRSRLEAAEGIVHAHLDPDAVEEETIATLAPLFEAVLQRRDGEWVFESV